jgi:hypothetical protein
MKRHNLETNFQFLKGLKINSNLGNTKIKFTELTNPKESERLYKAINFRKQADEFQIGNVKSRKIKLTEYQSGQPMETLYLKH